MGRVVRTYRLNATSEIGLRRVLCEGVGEGRVRYWGGGGKALGVRKGGVTHFEFIGKATVTPGIRLLPLLTWMGEGVCV